MRFWCSVFTKHNVKFFHLNQKFYFVFIYPQTILLQAYSTGVKQTSDRQQCSFWRDVASSLLSCVSLMVDSWTFQLLDTRVACRSIDATLGFFVSFVILLNFVTSVKLLNSSLIAIPFDGKIFNWFNFPMTNIFAANKANTGKVSSLPTGQVVLEIMSCSVQLCEKSAWLELSSIFFLDHKI